MYVQHTNTRFSHLQIHGLSINEVLIENQPKKFMAIKLDRLYGKRAGAGGVW
jgi:hypothetical protein